MTRRELRDRLFQAGLLVPTGVEGVYGRSQRFEEVVASFDRYAGDRLASAADTVLRFPPVMSREAFERTDFLRSFPQLMGSVHTWTGDDRSHAELVAAMESGAAWAAGLPPAELVLEPAVCHPVYPTCSGRLPEGGRRFDVAGWCFRHEPSADPMRLQAFRMHEWVALGDPAKIGQQHEEWVVEASAVLTDLDLSVEAAVANDPFFGRGGRMLAASQREEQLKIELVAAVGEGEPVALASCNRHLDHFGGSFGIVTASGEVAHSACVGLGLERVAVALLDRHGLDPAAWPAVVRERLWP